MSLVIFVILCYNNFTIFLSVILWCVIFNTRGTRPTLNVGVKWCYFLSFASTLSVENFFSQTIFFHTSMLLHIVVTSLFYWKISLFWIYDSNPEFQQSVKELNEKIGVVKEDLKVRSVLIEVLVSLLHFAFLVIGWDMRCMSKGYGCFKRSWLDDMVNWLCRTKKTSEKLYKSVDDVWAEAEATSKKVELEILCVKALKIVFLVLSLLRHFLWQSILKSISHLAT